jgi:hypothetical protein
MPQHPVVTAIKRWKTKAIHSNANASNLRFIGPGLVDIPAGGQTFHYTTPDSFNGKLRIIAVAVTPQRVGVFAGATEVRGPLVLTPNIPAFIAPHDEVLNHRWCIQ